MNLQNLLLISFVVLMTMCDQPAISAKESLLGLSKWGDDWELKVWSPQAQQIRVHIYERGYGAEAIASLDMKEGYDEVWSVNLDKKYLYKYYTIQINDGHSWYAETVDPYAKLTGVNGQRAYLASPKEADPEGWEADQQLQDIGPENAIIYELQIRDFSIDSSSGSNYPGKYLAFTERATQYEDEATGVAHLKELGITHVHLLPTFDFRSIDESRLEDEIYNWGYDPLNYNVPEGSFSMDPFDPLTRVNEFKQMVMALHEAGIGVVMDVVYNHTGFTKESNFNLIVPDYYYRLNDDGSYSNASACNNETASEKPMMRKFMLESMKYWMEEYHIDGFRVDLMGIHDIETMNLISKELRALNPQTLLYGEGWAAGSSPLPEEKRALKQNAKELDRIAVFSDEIRDGMKGHWTSHEDRGFISGKKGNRESVKFGITGAVAHPQVNYESVNNTNKPWAANPLQIINYVSAHDGMTLYDKLLASVPGESAISRKNMGLLANTIVLTSQGIPFLHAGVDFLRTKQEVDNSFESPDAINAIDWSLKVKHKDVFNYYQKIIQLRKDHPAFRMTTAEQVAENLTFVEDEDPLLIAYMLNGKAVGDRWSEIMVIFNGDLIKKKVQVAEGIWNVYLLNQSFEQEDIISGQVTVNASSAAILFRQE